MQIIEKTRPTSYGVPVTHWVALRAELQLYAPQRDTDAPQPAGIVFAGYASKASFEAGELPLVCREVRIADVSQLSSYAATVFELLGAALVDPASVIHGGTVVLAEYHPPVPESEVTP